MPEKKKNYKLVKRLNLILAVLFLLASIVAVYVVNYSMRQQTLKEAEAKAQIILQRNLATHHFFADYLKPHVFQVLSADLDEDYFDPIWMSSTYAVREMYKIFTEQYPLGYYYKEAAINARSPENEADNFERDFILRLNQDPELQTYSGTREIDGEKYFVVLQKGETMSASCLMCHDTPERAPAGLVAIYGPKNSFGRYEGEVVSAVSIRIPLQEAYKQADRVSFRMSSILFISFALLFSGQYVLFSKGLTQPLKAIQEKAEQIATKQEFLGDQIPTPDNHELGKVADAFNLMSKNLRQNRDELEERIQELEQFASTISHNLRAPLRAINGISSLIEEDVAAYLTDETRDYFARIKTSSKNMDILIEDLLQLSQIGLQEPKFSHFDISALAQAVFDSLVNDEKDRNIEFSVHQSLNVYADKELIQVLLYQLISNALKFTVDRPTALIEFGHMQEQERQVFYLKDNGVGFPMEYSGSLFKPFEQIHTDLDESSSGIGLAISKRIIQHHKGSIWVESQAGEGTTIFFYFGEL